MGVTLTKIVEKMELRNLTPDVDMTQREVKIPDINRPALQLAGFFDHFDWDSMLYFLQKSAAGSGISGESSEEQYSGIYYG